MHTMTQLDLDLLYCTFRRLKKVSKVSKMYLAPSCIHGMIFMILTAPTCLNNATHVIGAVRFVISRVGCHVLSVYWLYWESAHDRQSDVIAP